MTLPGKMLTESIDRLATTINAAKAHSDQLKAQSLATPTTPVTLGEVSANEPGGIEPKAQG